ncbi:8-oxoguanine glycosylase ogg1 [Chytriomyces hyalinus]|nr:8-oxoguanine glycosylase ogg1 [Chytriomyces hyalinus]
MGKLDWWPLVGSNELRLSTTLFNGQSFSWVQTGPRHYSNVFGGVIVTLRQMGAGQAPVEYAVWPKNKSASDNIGQELSDYFQLHLSCTQQLEQWRAKDSNFARRVPTSSRLNGTRLLRQPPVECLFAFVCSANNNIARITGMVQALKRTFGLCVGSMPASVCDWLSIDELEQNDNASSDVSSIPYYNAATAPFYQFPTVKQLCEQDPAIVESTLRQLGFGYRAAYIAKTAQMLTAKEPSASEWLHGLRTIPYQEAKAGLLELMGIGPKVADCILLMSLDKPDAIPVDTHMWRIAKRDYGLSGSSTNGKSLTPKNYAAIGDKFREIFGDQAGWAQSLLFSAEIGSGGDDDTDSDSSVKAEADVKLEVVKTESNGVLNNIKTELAVVKVEVGTGEVNEESGSGASAAKAEAIGVCVASEGEKASEGGKNDSSNAETDANDTDAVAVVDAKRDFPSPNSRVKIQRRAPAPKFE